MFDFKAHLLKPVDFNQPPGTSGRRSVWLSIMVCQQAKKICSSYKWDLSHHLFHPGNYFLKKVFKCRTRMPSRERIVRCSLCTLHWLSYSHLITHSSPPFINLCPFRIQSFYFTLIQSATLLFILPALYLILKVQTGDTYIILIICHIMIIKLSIQRWFLSKDISLFHSDYNIHPFL